MNRCDYLHEIILQFAIQGSGMFVTPHNMEMIQEVQKEIRRQLKEIYETESFQKECKEFQEKLNSSIPNYHEVNCPCGCGKSLRCKHLRC